MCLAIPGKIIEFFDLTADIKMARVDFDGIIKNICIEWIDVNPGDYLMAHAGVAICKIDKDEAEKTISKFKEVMLSIETGKDRDYGI